ncbi:MAG: AgmX/PglI C-terminal domain-containing protein [Deltaproteobacteria bacterium]|nr:AgmX/PglI C-terminal domain-containing protein [Deltaproteobacteria bacterium]MBW2533679.1 AgmX/PglI C-terminal domain-containing protein [Deltaproteobacteria bacterium]
MRRSVLIAFGLVAAAWLPAMVFGACRGGPSGPTERPALDPRSPTGDGQAPQPQTSAPTPGGAEPSDAGSPEDAAPSPESGPLSALQRCDEPLARIVNVPDGGVVFNNAMTSADAGFIDRTQGIIDALVGESSRLQCCFGPWAQAHPGAEGKLMLLLDLDPAGRVRRADTVADRSTITHPLAVRCVLDVARRVSYPKSPTDSPTLVEYPFVVAAGAR